MPSRASPDFLDRVLKSMNSIIEDRAWLIYATTLALATIVTVAISYATGVLPLIPDIDGSWHFQKKRIVFNCSRKPRQPGWLWRFFRAIRDLQSPHDLRDHSWARLL